MGGLLGSTALGYVQKTMITPLNGDDVSLYGTTFAAFVTFGYLLSVPLFWKAGKEYEKQQIAKDSLSAEKALMATD